MEEEESRSESNSQKSIETDSWDLSQGDPNDYFVPDTYQRIIQIQDITNMSSEMITDKIIKYWNTSKDREKIRDQLVKDDILRNASKRIIQNMKIDNPEEIDEMEDEFISRNVILENEYIHQDKAQQEEAERLSKLEEGSMIIHLDIRRAFDNLSPKMLNSFVQKMAESMDFKILKPFKNIIKKWMATTGAERIRIDGYKEFIRYYGGPQGSLWTPAIWNLYLTTILSNSPLKRMIRLYADNVFIWIAPNHVEEGYIKKILAIATKLLKVANLEINQDEIFAFWRGKKPKYKEIMSKIIKLEENQRILGFWFKLTEDGEWKYQIKFWLPMSPRRSLINISFKDRIMAFKAKALGSLYYQIQGWYLFGDPKDKFEWPNIDKNIRNAFIHWTGLLKVSYFDLAALGISLRFYLIDKLTEAYCLNYIKMRKKINPKIREKYDAAYEDISLLLQIKYRPEELETSKIINRMNKSGKNFSNFIARNEMKIKKWLMDLIDQTYNDEFYKDSDKIIRDFYLSKLDPIAKEWEKILNFQRKYTIYRRYRDNLLINSDNVIRWYNRAFWHLCLGKQMNRQDSAKFLEDISGYIRDQLKWTKVVTRAMDLDDIPDQGVERIKDFLNSHDWKILDDIIQIVDSYVAGDKNWKRQQILYVCYKYAKDIDRSYIDILQQKCQMLTCKDK